MLHTTIINGLLLNKGIHYTKNTQIPDHSLIQGRHKKNDSFFLIRDFTNQRLDIKVTDMCFGRGGTS